MVIIIKMATSHDGMECVIVRRHTRGGGKPVQMKAVGQNTTPPLPQHRQQQWLGAGGDNGGEIG